MRLFGSLACKKHLHSVIEFIVFPDFFTIFFVLFAYLLIFRHDLRIGRQNFFLMYEWLEELAKEAKNEYYLNLAKNAASDDDLHYLETTLGVSLPYTYKSFLKKWNGAEILGSRILSTDEVLDFAQEYGFSPFENEYEISDERRRHYYSAKPLHHLIFRTFDFSQIVYCFDTKPLSDSDYPVCQYEEDVPLEEILRPVYSNFEVMLIHDILYDVVCDPDFLVEDGSVVEENSEDLEKKCNYWKNRIKQTAKEKGLVLSPNFDLDSWT